MPIRRRTKVKIDIQVPEPVIDNYHEQAKNDLFDSKNPQSILFRHKQAIVTKGMACKNDFAGCLKFIKGLSANKTFEYALKEQSPGTIIAAPANKSNSKKSGRKGGKASD